MKTKFCSNLLLALTCTVGLLIPAQGSAGGHRISAGAFTKSAGADPISFGDPQEYSYTYINNSRDREIIVGLVPGLGYAVRFNPSKDWAVSVGGMLGATNNPFVGPYAGFAWEFWCPSNSFCLSLDYRATTAVYSYKKTVSGVSSISLGGTLW